MNIDSIHNGIVLDHIKAGKSMEIYKFLNLDALTWGSYFAGNMLPVTLGNILGGLFVGFTMWFGFLRKAK